MKKRELFLESSERIYKIIESYEYLIDVRKNPTDFSRVGKMGFKNMIFFTLNFSKKTLQAELNSFFKSIYITTDGVRKQAFSKGRNKILPKAFKILLDELIKIIYTATDLNMYKGYRLLAVDGSTVELQNTEELRGVFGYAENGGKVKVARAKISGLYDVENNIMIDAIIDNYKTSERELALRHIKKLIEYGLQNDLILFDRGYPSKEFMASLIDDNIKFVMRCPANFFKEVNSVNGDEEILYNHNGKTYKIRVVKFALDTDTEEILATNVFDESFTTDDFKILYFRRWGIETKYNELKHRLQLENFDGITETAVKQDFYATMFLANMAALAKMDSDEKIQENNKEKELKYKHKTNVNMMVSQLKDELILIMMEKDGEKRKLRYNNMMRKIVRNTIPIRPGRNNERNFKKSRDRYPMNARRGL